LSKQTKTTSSEKNTLPLVIVNPKSAGGSTKDNWAGIASDLRTHFGAFSVAFTKASGDGIVLARTAAESGRKFIIACGGDGTINEVANGILDSGTHCELGVLPSGTGGDFRRSLGMPSSPREAARSLRNGRTETMDVGKVTFRDHAGLTTSRFFMNISSFGLAASIIERVKASNSLSWLPVASLRGRASFALSTLQEVSGMDAVLIKIAVDGGDEKTLQTINFCVANAQYFGGGMKIAPDAKINDGFFDVINIGDIGTAKIMLNAYSIYRGTHVEMAEVNCTRAKRVEARSANETLDVLVEIDGELPGKLPAVYEVVPDALKIRVPR